MTLNELLAAAGIVKNATAVNENSAPRIGVLFTNIINFIKDHFLYSENPITLSLIYQNPVANFAALATTYPNPLRDWAAMVEDESVIYCYNGSTWANTGLKAFPEDMVVKPDLLPILIKLAKNLPLVWTDGKYITNSGTGSDVNYQATLDYYPVLSGQKLKCNIAVSGAGDIVAIYDVNKNFVEAKSGTNFEITFAYDGFIRFSNDKRGVAEPTIILVDESYKSLQEVSEKTDYLSNYLNNLNLNIQYDLPLVWTDGKYITNSGTGSDVNYQATLDYYPVLSGQKLKCNIAVSGAGDIVAIYDVNKNFVEAKSGTNFEITFAYDGFIRFSNDKRGVTAPTVENVTKKYTELINKLNILSDKDVKLINKNSFTPFAKQTSLLNFIPSTPKIDLAYRGQINNKKRYLAVSFDDLSDSDISWVIPLFNKYGFKSTFNRINYGVPNDLDISRYSAIINGGHEIGDHTITHQMYPFYSPLFNGQNPNSLDGTQQPFPTNADLKNNRGDGKNIFGKTITDIVNFGYDAPVFTISWQNLSDSQCQQIRDAFSLYRDETLLPLMDSLSNELIGTTGNSLHSWNGTKYTGGIFSDCKTSSNHEVWERICLIQYLYYKNYFGMNFDFAQWSLPGSRNSYLYFEENGKYYYDRGKTQFANDLGKLQSSYITDNAGILKTRSWIDVLREFGYKMTHDALFPGRNDGNPITEFSHHLTINSKLSKKDALIYPTERTIPYYNYSAYNEAFFNGVSNYGKKMYNHRVGAEDGFYNAIENIRNKTANGIIAGCVWDSADTFEEKIYWEEILKFCKATGIEVITKSEAFDIAFNNVVEIGNLIYNPELRNIAKEYFPDANFTNRPDGYYGDCILEVDEITNENILYANHVNDLAYYSHYGIPHGNLKFSCSAKGSGNIWIFAIRNNTVLGEQSDLLSSISIEETNYTDKNTSFLVKNEPETAYEGIYEGLGNKICGLKIMYNGIIRVKNISLIKI